MISPEVRKALAPLGDVFELPSSSVEYVLISHKNKVLVKAHGSFPKEAVLDLLRQVQDLLRVRVTKLEAQIQTINEIIDDL
jgi:hypothetical protein